MIHQVDHEEDGFNSLRVKHGDTKIKEQAPTLTRLGILQPLALVRLGSESEPTNHKTHEVGAPSSSTRRSVTEFSEF